MEAEELACKAVLVRARQTRQDVVDTQEVLSGGRRCSIYVGQEEEEPVIVAGGGGEAHESDEGEDDRLAEEGGREQPW